MLYAKSIGVDPLGRFFTSPDGVNANTLSENKSRSLFNRLINSLSVCKNRGVL